MINPLRKMIVCCQFIQALECDLERVFCIDADGHLCSQPSTENCLARPLSRVAVRPRR